MRWIYFYNLNPEQKGKKMEKFDQKKSYQFEFENEFSGLGHSVKISNVEIVVVKDDDFEDDHAYVEFTIESERGKENFIEWISKNDKGFFETEKTDTHLETNQIENLFKVFPECNDGIHGDDLLPIFDILAKIDNILKDEAY